MGDDEAHSYPGPSSEWDAMPCHERLQHAKRKMPIDARAATPQGWHKTARLFEKIRPRWWYFAVLSCSDVDLHFEYEISAKNLPYGGFFEEFSTHQRYFVHVSAAVFFVYLVLLALQLRAVGIIEAMAGDDSADGKAKRPFVTLLTSGLSLEVLACLLALIHYSMQGYQGEGMYSLYVASKFLSMASKFCLISLLLLVSQGKCVSYILVLGDVSQLARLLTPFLASSFLLEVWAERAESSKYTTDWVYSNPIGWLIVLMDVALLALYLSNLRETLEVEKGRGDERFYRRWGCLYALWFLALPSAAVLSSAVLATYARHTVSLIITQAANAVAFASLVAGLWPSNPHAKFRLAFAPVEDVMENCVTPPTQRRLKRFPTISPTSLPEQTHEALSFNGRQNSSSSRTQLTTLLPSLLSAGAVSEAALHAAEKVMGTKF